MDFCDFVGNIIFIGLITYVVNDWYSRIDPVPLVAGKKVLITGASRGIGEKIAYYYARCGASLMLVARDVKLQKVLEQCREIGKTGATFHYLTADFKDTTVAERVINTTVEKLGGLDIVTLNHGKLTPIQPWGSGSNSIETLDEIMTINVLSNAHLTAHALPHLKKSNGCLCVVSSANGKVATPYAANYTASKFALDGFFSSIRQDLKMAKQQVSVTLAIIGLTATESAMEATKGATNSFIKPADPTATATAIVHGTVARRREIHYPFSQGIPLARLYGLFPDIFDYFGRQVYKEQK